MYSLKKVEIVPVGVTANRLVTVGRLDDRQVKVVARKLTFTDHAEDYFIWHCEFCVESLKSGEVSMTQCLLLISNGFTCTIYVTDSVLHMISNVHSMC